MGAKVLPADKLQIWIDKLIGSYSVFAPVIAEPAGESPGISSFMQIKPEVMPALDIRTDVPPKELIFKRVELLLSYKYGEEGLVINQGCAKRPRKVIFGIRPCDANAFEVIDTVFLDPRAPECSYAAERASTALITLACKETSKTCFCTSVDGSPVDKVGDVWMMDIGNRYYIETITPVGEELVAIGAELFADAAQQDNELVERISTEVTGALRKISIPTAKGLSDLFNNDTFWQRMADKCLSCGACTFLCPTCHCFDVQDEGSIKQGNRYRTWDSCMFSRFTRAAGGHNPRVEHWKRLRQRMMHKFSYFIENSGVIGCVGCGRCIRSCPVAWDVRDFLENAFIAAGGSPVEFIEELPGENDKPRSCDINLKQISETGVGVDER